MTNTVNCDVVILGASISSTAIGAVLARNRFEVVILDEGAHPRFAIGESMLPQTSMWLWIVGERFGVPELQNLAHTSDVQGAISSACGVKRAIGFAYHRTGKPQAREESHQLIPPENPLFAESHLFREHTDEYVLKAARRYGAQYRERCVVSNVELSDDGVDVATSGGERFHARFLVDGLGGRSRFAESQGIREKPTRLRTKTRSIFNHFVGVPPFDDVAKLDVPLARGWHEGTLHHVFDGGWFWVIPFDNHATAESRLCSVGLMLREDRYPRSGEDPAVEFGRFVDRFPDVRAHLAAAQPVRDWVSTGRIQYSASRCTGPRYALLSNTYAFIDPLYSTGLLSTFESIYALSGALIEALREDRFDLERFSYVERLQRHQIDDFDTMISTAYRAMGDFDTWHAWTQLWLATVVFGDTYVFGRCLKYLETGDPTMLDTLQEVPGPRAQSPFATQMSALGQRFDSLLTSAERGALSRKDASEGMLDALRGADWLPKAIYGWGSKDARHLDFNPRFPSWLEWGLHRSPRDFRQRMFDFDPSQLDRTAAAKMASIPPSFAGDTHPEPAAAV